MARGCPRPKGPKNTVFCDFPPLGVRSVKTQDCKKVAQFSGETFECPVFPPKNAPSSGKLRFYVFGPEFLQVPRGCPRPKGPKTPVFCDFPAVGVRSAQTQNVKNCAGRSFWGERISPPKVPLAPGNCVFFRFWPGISLSAKGLP